MVAKFEYFWLQPQFILVQFHEVIRARMYVILAYRVLADL